MPSFFSNSGGKMVKIVSVGNSKNGDKGFIITRPSDLGNIFIPQRESEREVVIKKYDLWLHDRLQRGDKIIVNELNRLLFDTALSEDGIKVICVCAPKKCHGDVIARIVNKELEEQRVGSKTTWSNDSEIGYEVSSSGDTRFSALYARLSDGRTIEEHYQCDVKGYDPGGTRWKSGKGKKPLNPNVNLWDEYLNLWKKWGRENVPLLEDLYYTVVEKHGGVLKDKFAKTSVNQANALSVICNALFSKPD